MEDLAADKVALAVYKKVDARRRRLCERKPSGKLQVPFAVHEAWSQAGKTRDELRVLLEKNDFDKDIGMYWGVILCYNFHGECNLCGCHGCHYFERKLPCISKLCRFDA